MKVHLRNNTALDTLTYGNTKAVTVTDLYLKGCTSLDQWTNIKDIYNTTGNTLKYISADVGAISNATITDLDILYAFLGQTSGVNNYGRVTYADGVFSEDLTQVPDLGLSNFTVALCTHAYDSKIAAIQTAWGITITVTVWGLTLSDFYNDSVAYNLCASKWGTGGIVTAAQLAAVTDIGTTFKGTTITDLKWIKYFSSITSIPSYAFQSCTSLGDCGTIEWPSGLTSIGAQAFQGCTGITLSTLPSGLTQIGSYAFSQCNGIVSLTVPISTPPTLGEANFTSNLAHIYVPSASVDLYKAASGWSDFASIIEAIPE